MDKLKCLSQECIHLLNKYQLIKPVIKAELIKDTLSKVEIIGDSIVFPEPGSPSIIITFSAKCELLKSSILSFISLI